MKIVLITFLIFLLSACLDQEPPLTPLSESEKVTLTKLQEKYKQKKDQYNAYKAEKNRVESIEASYGHKHISLNDFSIYKTNQFDDGRYRACYKGDLVNKGSEIVERVSLNVMFYSSVTGEEIYSWDTSLVYANDELLDNKTLTQKEKAAVLVLSGHKMPLKPNSTKEIGDCLSDVFLSWEVKDIKYEMINLKIRPKLTKVDAFDALQVMTELHPLQERADKFN